MKRLIFKLFLFLLPIILIILSIKLDKRLQYEGLKNDCFYHGLWFYDRLFDNKKPVDIAFLGSSQTMSAINDSIIEAKLSHSNLKVANFGYCRLGMNLNYVILKEILSTKKPKIVLIEVREDENRYSHPVFPFLATSNDVVSATWFFNKNLISDFYKHLAFKVEIIQEMLFKKRDEFYPSAEEFGFCPSKDTASASVLKNEVTNRDHPKPKLTHIEKQFHLRFTKTYLEKINRLCNENNIKIYFLFLETYGISENQLLPNEAKLYAQYGNIIYIPKPIFKKSQNWFDANHLNTEGARELSEWLGNDLQKQLKPQITKNE